MPPVRFAPNTKSPSTPSDYTDAQYAALEGVKQTTPKLRFGAARPEFMNHAMLADGSITADLAPIRAAAAAATIADRAAYRAFVDAHRDAIVDESLEASLKQQFIVLRSASKHDLAEELEAHIAEQRFLFIVDADLVPRIYFQCAVAGNPDVELATDDA